MDRQLPDGQAGFRKGSGTRDQIANLRWIMEKTYGYGNSLYMCFVDYKEPFDYMNHSQLWNALRMMGIPEHITILIMIIYKGHEATVHTHYGETEWFKVNKRVRQGLSVLIERVDMC